MRLVVLSGAGISAESGIATFRGADGLWEGHSVTEVASPEGWRKNREFVLDFYNQRRRNVCAAEPNEAHLILAELESVADVQIITQNVDDLHERAGSKNILHLHGKIRESRSSQKADLVYEIKGTELNLGDKCELGSQLRPNIVWFGESVSAISEAADIISTADVVIIIGTSMQVYPAAGLIDYAPDSCETVVIDPNTPGVTKDNVSYYEMNATAGMKKFREAYFSS